MPLDDISHLEGDPKQLAKLVTFRLASNRPKEKAAQYVAANNLVDAEWRVIPLSTSEDPLWTQIEGNKSRAHQVRGEEVRMINVRACISSRGDIFDGRRAITRLGETADKRAKYVERLERYAIEYQGEPYRVYLATRVRDKTADKKLKSYMDEFLASPLREQHRWLARTADCLRSSTPARALRSITASCRGGRKQPSETSGRAWMTLLSN